MTAGWSLAQAISCIVQHKCGVSLYADQDTSIALIMNFEDDYRLPRNAVSDAEDELLRALAAGKIEAVAIEEKTGGIVEIAKHLWQQLQISPNLDGDTVVGGRYCYREVRLLSEAVRQAWPPRVLGQKSRLSLVHSSDPTPSHIGMTNPVRSMSIKRDADAILPVPSERRSRYDWPAFATAVEAIILDEGMPGFVGDPNWTQQKLEGRMANWCKTNWGMEPSESSIRTHVVKTMNNIKANQGN